MKNQNIGLIKDINQNEEDFTKNAEEINAEKVKGGANVNLQAKVSPSIKEIFDTYADENGIRNKDLMEEMVNYFFSSDQVVSLNARDEIEAAQKALVNAMGQFSAIVNKANIRVSEVRDKNRKDLKKKDEIIAGLEAQYVQLKDQFDIVSGENEGFSQVKKNILEEKHAVEIAKLELENKLGTLEYELGQKVNVCDDQAQEITKLKENIARLQKDLELSNGVLSEMNQTFKLIEDTVKANVADQQAKVKEAYAQNEAEIQKVVSLKNDQISGLEDQIKMLKENLEMKINLAVEKKELEFMKEINALKEENVKLQKELEDKIGKKTTKKTTKKEVEQLGFDEPIKIEKQKQ